jgi:hypothetical protein
MNSEAAGLLFISIQRVVMSDSQASAAQVAANRANSQFSTGPRTPEGKARASQNAVKHGLFTASLAWSGGPLNEKGSERDALRAGLLERYAPEGIEEELIVDEMAALWWRLVRLNGHAQWRLRNRVKPGADLLAAVKESESLGVAEARLQRALSRLRKDLLFLQRYRQGETREQRRVAAASSQARVAQIHAETEAFLRDSEGELERAREEDAAQEASLRAEPIDPAALSAAAPERTDSPEPAPAQPEAEGAPHPAPEEESEARSAA